ncbi:laminin subunit beta-1 [Scaptodrosophila lebanonensis]|uniref:Laminin subunit beta-1 n=1 Tax=Drosophila lebanonensis TaxID=7225 RepID=A0A6J2U8F9_DROLE|nr:laminin subunit beta-1 [Scaptodrosophila lebanonensis]XP_030383467.1 laminin subunit beta-1 [Scaptodrosophila lebanonensis]
MAGGCSGSLIAIFFVLTVVSSLHELGGSAQKSPPQQHYGGRRDRPRNPPRQYIKTHPCERSSCYPATGNLLIGRENRLKASSTCGLQSAERFCILSHLQDKKCFLCDSREDTRGDPHKNHRIGQIIYKTKPGTNVPTWWQSENGKENVTIQLDLEAEFHFTHLIITFTTFRPAAMYIERSFDFGQTWHVYRYFAYDCADSFPGVPTVLRNITDVMCTSRYSHVEPSRNGEVIYRVLPPNSNVPDPYAEHVQNLLKMTNLRIKMTKLHKLGDNLLDNRLENEEKYYYGISNMVVRGSCSCYGHASQCLPLDNSVVTNDYDMVHGRCECTHNTKGLNCESCEDFFNDMPWKPAFGKQTNACKKCECNDHAVRCHFDEAVFESSGRVSGGVCDSCMHNTQGQHCEECLPYFYRDPAADIRSPHVCKPCDCDPSGALDDGICDSVNDPENGVEAGACHCKPNVKGRRCDACKDGYWNLDPQSPEGCEACTCNILGTIDNSGCNMYSGECTCKRLVTGKDCNQCAPETFGLSESPDGCNMCECDAGGSYDNYCDVITGQCRCRPHMMGRTCSQPNQNYFIPQLQVIHDAEGSDLCISYTNNGNCSVVPQQASPDRPADFTGIGYTRMPENSELIIHVDDIPRSMPYDVVIRYQVTTPGDWEDAFITLVRPDEVDPQGECAGSVRPGDDIRESHIPFSLPDRDRQVVALHNVCLEAGKLYKFKITFERRRHNEDNPTATILIDSLTLIPRIEVTPVLSGSPLSDTRLSEYYRNNCNQSLYDIRYMHLTPDRCRELDNYLSTYIHDGASMCNCNPTGSLSKECDRQGGFCHCKPNVVGRQCDQCAPGTYGFGPEGCKACDCNSIGSKDNNCDLLTGQCVCHPNTYGRECDECQPGYWNFPNCQACECNGHAAQCDAKTGQCLNCQDSTTGYGCDSCLDGYYGNPFLGSEIGCRPCRCPDTVASGLSHADSCSLDTRNNNMLCHCKEGYAGARCEICADNYFGDTDAGGSCEKCDCSNNIDPYDTGNCDRETGQCLKCLYETTGDHCELCRDGFFGNALEQNCQRCDCELLGTNATVTHCDRYTGQCPCLPNVKGLRCDECAVNHWKIASGEGCEACNCDPIGALEEQCQPYTGECRCRPGFGGRACNQCEKNYWGNPNEKCQPCECEPYGAADFQCDRETGQCVCHEGIGGYKCNECARGYLGQFPHCAPCGECFNNWDMILSALEEATEATIQRAREIKQVGATGAYTAEFSELDKKLQNIRYLLQNNTVSLQDIDNLDAEASELKKKLAQSHKRLDETEINLNDIYNSLALSAVELEGLQNHSQLVKKLSNDLKNKGIKLQESNIEGALNLTRNAYERVTDLSALKDEARDYAANTDRNCKRVEGLTNKISNETDETAANDRTIDEYRSRLTELTLSIPELNNEVCGKPGDPCDSLCGGAGCGKCGGLSCEHGARTRAAEALKVAKDTEEAITKKKDQADQTIRALTQAKVNASEAYLKAKSGFEEAERYLNKTEGNIKVASALINNLNNFQNNKTALPSESKKLAQDTLQLDLKLDPNEIDSLGVKINDAVSSLKDVESIIYKTRHDLDLVNRLQSNANATKATANDILERANTVVQNLDAADESQAKAQDAIKQANSNIELAAMDLEKIDLVTNEAEEPANATAAQVEDLDKKANRLQKNMFKNELDAKEIKKEANRVKSEAMRARGEASNLQSSTSATNQTLTDRANRSENARERAKKLLQRASILTVDTNEKMNELQQLQAIYQDKQSLLEKLQNNIKPLSDQLTLYLANIQENAERYRQCVSVG